MFKEKYNHYSSITIDAKLSLWQLESLLAQLDIDGNSQRINADVFCERYLLKRLNQVQSVNGE